MNKSKLSTTEPLLILLYGFPGSGKTHFARQITDNIQAAHVHGDKIRNELFEEPRFDKQENSIVNQLMDYMTEEFLSAGMTVIYDVNAARGAQRRSLREMARKKGARTVIIWFQMDPDTAYARIQKRDRRKSDDKYARSYNADMFRRYIGHMQQPRNEDYVVVSGKHTYPSQQSAFLKKLMEDNLIDTVQASKKVPKPGLINLVPRPSAQGRVDLSRRNINIL